MGKFFIILIAIIVIWSIFAGTAETEVTNDDDTTTVSAIAEVNNISLGYLTESEYNNGDYSEESIKRTPDFTVGVPQYMVVDFKIKTLADNNGGESVKLMARPSNDYSAVNFTIQEAPTGKLETVDNGNGTSSYDLYYTILATKDQEKSVRMILKLVPNVNGEIAFEICWQGVNGTLSADVVNSLVFHVGSET